MGETVFVLGAGFSRFAGMPLVQQLREQVFRWLDENPSDPRVSVHMSPLPNWPEFPNGKFWDSIRRIDPKNNRGFEELIIDLRRAENEYPASVQARHALCYACTRLLWDKQRTLVELPESYLSFARIVRSELGVISFNWDLVCERALETEWVSWGYSLGAQLPVIKPHGSLNWTNHLMQEDWRRIITNPVGFAQIAPTDCSISYMSGAPFEDPLLAYDSSDLRCLLFPGCDDLLDHEVGPRARKEKVRLWADANSLLERAKRVAFIGYSLPRYDSEARQVLEHACRGKTVTVCNPDPAVIEEFRSLFQRSEILSELNKFEDSIFSTVRGETVSA